MHPPPLVAKRRDYLLSRVLSALRTGYDLFQRAPTLPIKPRRIVVLKSCCLGDVLCATPLLAALRCDYPEVHIVAGVGRWSQAALAHNPDLDGLLDLESVGLGRWRPLPYLRVLRRLRAGRFDLAIVLDRSPLMTVLPWLAGIPLRAGIDSAGRGFALNMRTPWDRVEHEAELFLRIGRSLGLDTVGAAMRFCPSADDRQWAANLWQHEALHGQRVVVLFPGGGRNPGMTFDLKRWPAERYAMVADYLTTEQHCTLIVAGNTDDAAVCQHIVTTASGRVLNLCGRTTLGQLAALYERANLYLGNDTGPMHLAAAVGLPVLAIFGPTDPAVYAPWLAAREVLYDPVSQRTDAITVEQVIAAALRLLERRAP